MDKQVLTLKAFEAIHATTYQEKERNRLPRKELLADAVVSFYFSSGRIKKDYFEGDIHIDTIGVHTRRESGLYVVSATVNIGDGTLRNGYSIVINQDNHVITPKGKPYGFVGTSGFVGTTDVGNDFDNSLTALLDQELLRAYEF